MIFITLIQLFMNKTSLDQQYLIFQQFITKIIMKNKQDNYQSAINHSNPTEYRLQLTKISDQLPYGEFLAYCIVSKQSSKGLQVHQRLLTINTHTKQLGFYNIIPVLPIQSIQELGEPNEKVNYQSADRFEFLPQMIRNGHVNLRWIDNQQVKSWKLIMGSNNMAQQMLAIINKSSESRTTHGYSKELQQKQNNQTLESLSDKKSEKKGSPKRENGKKKLDQVNVTFGSKRPEINSPISLQISLLQQKIQSKLKTEAQQINIYIHRVDKLALNQKIIYPKHETLLQKKPKQVQNKSNNQSLVNQWLQSQNSHEKSIIYLKFVNRCKKKIEVMMNNFFTNHLQHEREDKICVIYDGEIKYSYCPLIETLENQGTPDDLTRKIMQEQQMLREFQCLDYLSNIDHIGENKVLVPMACIVSHKGMKFYCKSTLDFVSNKGKISKDMNQYAEMFEQLQKQCKFKLDGKEQIYQVILRQQKQLFVIYKVRSLPQISPYLPISRQYIDSYLTQGVISDDKDVRAIRKHINSLIVQNLLGQLTQKNLFSCFELITIIRKLGLSYHYLHLIIEQARSKNLHYLQRVLQSQILAKSIEWQIRRKIQFQIFKKREFGFAINQIKMSMAMFFREDKYYIRLLTKVINDYFGCNNNFQAETVQNNVVGEMMLASLMQKLNLDYIVDVRQEDFKGWVWKDNSIEACLHIQPSIEVTTLNSAFLDSKNRQFLSNELIKQLNYQVQQSSLQTVLTHFGLSKDKHGFYLISPQYELLNQTIKSQVNFYLSHFLTPSRGICTSNVLQSLIYNTIKQDNNFLTYLQYLILLNKIKWLIKEDSKLKAEELIEKSIKRATLWNQSLVLIQIYDFYSKYKFKYGYINQALEYRSKSLQLALEYYEEDNSIQAQILIAEQAFQAGNFNLLTHSFTKSLNLFSIAEKIIKKINTEGQSITLNPQFILLYSRKCQIYLIFGQYQNCLDECLEGLECCRKFRHYSVRVFVDENEFKIYEILFRCYQTKNMRKQMIEVANICCEKYFEDKVKLNQAIDQNLLSEVIKILWISIIKQVQTISPLSTQLDPSASSLKYIYLKKVHKQLVLLAKKLTFQYRYNKKQVSEFLKKKAIHQGKSKTINLLKNAIVDCLASVTMNSSGFKNEKLFDEEALTSPWLMLEVISCITSFEFLVGVIQNSLRLYAFQY